MNQVAEYIQGVRSGEIVAGELVRLAVDRHVRDLKEAKDRGFHFDEMVATEALDLFPEIICHVEGEWANQPLKLSPWQQFILWNVFGWRRRDGTRRFRKAYISIARKNGKSLFASGLALFLLVADTPLEHGAQIYCAATKEDQARIVFRVAKRIAQMSSELKPLLQTFQRSITFPQTMGFIQPVGSDSNTQDGYNPHCIIRDELHAWQERHRGMAEVLATGGGARRQPLEITITTAGSDSSAVWKEEATYGQQVLQSANTGKIINDERSAFIATMDRGDDPFDPANWLKANPNLGVSVKVDYLASQANEAQHKPGSYNQFLRYHANMQTADSERWMKPDVWADCNAPLSDLHGRDCYGGLDIGTRDDLSAFCLVFPVEDHVEILCFAWCCADGSRDTFVEPFSSYVRSGELVRTDGDTTDFAEIYRTIEELATQFQIRSVAYDPDNATECGQNLQERFGLEVEPFFQSCRKFNEPVREFSKMVAERNVRHGKNGLLAWAVGNVVLKEDAAGLVMPDKRRGKSHDKIDPAVAMLMAFSECKFFEREEASVYAEKDLLIIE